MSRLAIVAALEALDAGDQRSATQILLDALEASPRRIGVRCPDCRRRFELAGAPRSTPAPLHSPERRRVSVCAACGWDGDGPCGYPEFTPVPGGCVRLAADVNGIGWERLSDVEMRSIVFLDKPLLQASAFHLVAGRKGMGKGTVLADIAARVNRGELGGKRSVVWIGSEDSAAIDMKPRIVAAAATPKGF